jgi:hypothetical protein
MDASFLKINYLLASAVLSSFYVTLYLIGAFVR